MTWQFYYRIEEWYPDRMYAVVRIVDSRMMKCLGHRFEAEQEAKKYVDEAEKVFEKEVFNIP